MTTALSITVVGAGAIGSAVAFSLSRAGFAPKLVARRENLTAIRRDRLRVDKWDGGGTVRLEATDNPSELGQQDLVIGTMKTQDRPAGLATLTPLIGLQTITAADQLDPMGYFDGQGGALEGQRVTAVDPDGALLTALPARSVIGSVVYMGVTRVAPGVVRWTSGNKCVLGEAGGPIRERTERVAAVLRQSGFDVTIADDIRAEIWTKLIGNAAFNPLSTIARADRRDHERPRSRPHRASLDARSRSGRSSGWCPIGDGHREALCDQRGARRFSHLDAYRITRPAALSNWAGSSMQSSRSAHASASRHRLPRHWAHSPAGRQPSGIAS